MQDFFESAPISPRVLVVEDENRLREMLLRAVHDMGFEVSGVRSGEEGLKLLQDQPHETIMLDLNLPGMDGIEFFKQVREQWPATQVIILTGYGDLDAARQAIHLDVVEFLTKPCTLGEIEVALDRARRRLSPEQTPKALREQLFRVSPPPERPPSGEGAGTGDEGDAPPPRRLEDLEREHILAALDRNDGNRQATAEELGISVRTLYYRLDEYRKKGLYADE